jgi:hypothetical protein
MYDRCSTLCGLLGIIFLCPVLALETALANKDGRTYCVERIDWAALAVHVREELYSEGSLVWTAGAAARKCNNSCQRLGDICAHFFVSQIEIPGNGVVDAEEPPVFRCSLMGALAPSPEPRQLNVSDEIAGLTPEMSYGCAKGKGRWIEIGHRYALSTNYDPKYSGGKHLDLENALDLVNVLI